MHKDSRLILPIILIVTFIFIGIATLFYVRYTDKIKTVRQEKILREIKDQKQRIETIEVFEEFEGKG